MRKKDMTARKWLYISLNVSLGLLGVVLIFWGIVNQGEIAKPLMESIGTGFIAAGLINILDRALTLEPPTAQKQRIEVVAEQRVATPKDILDLKYKADKVDIIGVNLNYFLEELVNDKNQQLITRLLYNKLQLRILLMHPDSPFLAERALEDGVPHAKLIKLQKQAVTLCSKFHEQLRTQYDSATKAPNFDFHNTGHLQIRLISFCPHLTIYRVNDNVIYWGLYTSNKPGTQLPLFMTSQDRDWQLYKHLHEHIHGLLERDRAYPDLVSMPKMGEPTINEDLVKSIMQTA
jgi:hypothetical protein